MRAPALLLLALFLDVSAAHGAKSQAAWNPIAPADFKSRDQVDDPDATAIILADIGSATFAGEFEVVMERGRRVQLLVESAYEAWGTVDIPFYAKDKHQRVSHIEGQTYRLTSGGTIERVQLDKKSIFVEDVLDGEYGRVRFTMPALSPGCIVEYRYTITSDSPAYLQEWQFQTSEPTLWSEFSAEIPVVLNYKIAIQGITQFDLDESAEGQWPLGLAYGNMAQLANIGTTTRRFAMRNMPALREEPFITTLDDYCARIRFQLSEYQFPGQAPEQFLPTWEELARNLMKDRTMGAQFGRKLGTRDIEKRARALTESVSDPEAKLQAVYDDVRTTIDWDGTHAVFADKDLDDLLISKRGSSAEIGLLLTDLLRASSIEAHPVLVSTRSHGSIVEVYPILSQFNTVMTYVKIGNREWLLDATDRHRPMNLLPFEGLNDRAWVVDADKPKWVKIARPGLRQRQIVVSAALAEDGSITGTLQAMNGGYSALRERHALDDVNGQRQSEDYVRDQWLKILENLTIESFEFGNREAPNMPLVVNCTFVTQPGSDGSAGFLLPAVWVKPVDQNPLNAAQRKFPIDLGCGIDEIYTLRLDVPEGLASPSLPDPIDYDLPGGDGGFHQRAFQNGSQIEVSSHLRLQRTLYKPDEYPALRELFEAAVAGHAQQLAIARADGVPEK
jgi:hypothetical protein